MSVTVTYAYVSDFLGDYVYGKRILDFPEPVIDAIDEYYDGFDISNPCVFADNLALDMYVWSDAEVIFYGAGFPGVPPKEEVGDPDLFAQEYVEENFDLVFETLSRDFVVFCRYDGLWYFL